MSGSEDENPKFGSQTPFAEPSWYDSRNESPYYNEHHVKFRNQMRSFVDKEIIPNVDEWEKAEKIPDEIFIKASQAGLIPAVMGWPEDVMGPRPEGYDGFFTLIATDELCRCASGGVVWGLIGGNKNYKNLFVVKLIFLFKKANYFKMIQTMIYRTE